MSFSKAQKEAIIHKDGPMLVLAGPGSGKTLVITQRTRYLIEKHGISPYQILVITFTKAAANEMRERFAKLMGSTDVPVTFGTFHAIFFHILKQAYNLNVSNILREEKKQEYLKEIIHSLDLELDDEADFIAGITSEISYIKNDRISLEHYYAANCPEDVFREIYNQYQARLYKERLLDFDDMLVQCYELFHKRKDILEGWQGKYRYILIDEMQDANKVQYEVIRMLSAKTGNLFLVGDDDQSIYRFRGAMPEIMLNFQKDYPKSKTVLLNNNYRSTVNIVKKAGCVISYNQNRYKKDIIAVKGEGPPVDIKTFLTQREENLSIIKQIQEYVNQGNSYEDIAVLFRTNMNPRPLVEKFMEFNIPFIMKDVIPNIYEHWIAKNIFAYIRIALGSCVRNDYLQVMNRPNRYIGREALKETEISPNKLRHYYADKNWMQERIDKFEYDLKMLSEMVPYSAVHYIRNVIGYEEYLIDYAKYRKMKPDELTDLLMEIQESAKGCKSYKEWFSRIEDYSAQLKEKAAEMNREQAGVTLATLHSSKGLEFPKVFIIDVNEGIIPYKKAVLDADIQEERRLFYVGITRSMRDLHIYSVKEYFNKEVEVSRFIGEMKIGKEDLQPGVQVKHGVYGVGTIENLKDSRVTVYFKNAGKRVKLDIDYCVRKQILECV